MSEITYAEFEKVEMRVGKVIRAEEFPKARKPAYKLLIDFGEHGFTLSALPFPNGGRCYTWEIPDVPTRAPLAVHVHGHVPNLACPPACMHPCLPVCPHACRHAGRRAPT